MKKLRLIFAAIFSIAGFSLMAQTQLSDKGVVNACFVDVPGIYASYKPGNMFTFKVKFTNTGTTTLQLDALSPKTIVKDIGTPLIGGDLIAGMFATVVFDSTNFQLLSVSASAGSAPGWNLTGNSLIDTTQYLGSNNALPLITKTNGIERMRITSSGNIGIGTSTPGDRLEVNGGIVLSKSGNTTLKVNNATGNGEWGTSINIRAGNALGSGLAAAGGGEVNLFGGNQYDLADNVSGGNLFLRGGINTAGSLGPNDGNIIINTNNTERLRVRGNNGFVGIGTTTPARKLDVIGGIKADTIQITGGSPTSGKVLTAIDALGNATWQTPSGSGWSLVGNSGTTSVNFIGTNDSRPVRFRTNGTQRMIIDSITGNIGIGISAPTTTFEVSASNSLPTARFNQTNATSSVVTMTQNGSGQGLIVQRTSGGGSSSDMVSINATDPTDAGTALAITQTGVGNVIFARGTGGNDNFVMTNAGKIGIGTSSPAGSSIMHILKSGPTQILLENSSNSGFAGLIVSSNTTATAINGHFRSSPLAKVVEIGSSSAHDFNLLTSNTARMTISSVGKVGIGTTAPLNRLHIAGGVRIDTLAGGGNRMVTTDNNGVLSAQAIPSAADTNFWRSNGNNLSDSTTRFLGTKAGNSFPLIVKTNGTERMRVSSNGNIGIGTTAPNSALQFSNTLSNRKIVLFELANNDHQVSALGLNAGIMRYQIPATTNEHSFYAGTSTSTSTQLFRIMGNGRIKIPQPSILDLDNGISNKRIVLFESANNDHEFNGLGINSGVFRYQSASTGNDHVFYAATSATTSAELFRIKGAGNVGINNSSPSEKLDITGNVRFSGALMPNNTAGTSGQVLTSTGSGTSPTWQTPAVSGWGLTGNAGIGNANFIGSTNNSSVRFRTNNIQRLLLDSIGRIAIGGNSTASLGNLTVFGSPFIGLSQGQLTAYQNSSTGNAIMAEKNNTGAPGGTRTVQSFIAGYNNTPFEPTGSNVGVWGHVFSPGGTQTFGVIASFGTLITSPTSYVGLGGNNNKAAVFMGGNVGIGTTNPSRKLQVVGGIIADTLQIITISGGGNRMVTTDNNGVLSAQAIPTADNLGNHTATMQLELNGNKINSTSSQFFSVSGTDVLKLTGGSNAIEAISGQFRAVSGFSSSTPAYGFSTSTTSGFGNPAADVLSLITDGVERIRVTSTGNVGIGTNAPSSPLEVDGDMSGGGMVLSTQSLYNPISVNSTSNVLLLTVPVYIPAGTSRLRIASLANVSAGSCALQFNLNGTSVATQSITSTTTNNMISNNGISNSVTGWTKLEIYGKVDLVTNTIFFGGYTIVIEK